MRWKCISEVVLIGSHGKETAGGAKEDYRYAGTHLKVTPALNLLAGHRAADTFEYIFSGDGIPQPLRQSPLTMKRRKKTASSEKAQNGTTTANDNGGTAPPAHAQPNNRPAPSPSPAPSTPTSSASATAPNPWFGSKQKNGEPSTSALIICRNK